jgi:hypothetical protein
MMAQFDDPSDWSRAVTVVRSFQAMMLSAMSLRLRS